MSDPAKPVPFRARPIQPMGYAEGQTWSRWLVDDQREASGRLDVLAFVSDVLADPLKKDYDWSKEVAAIKSPTMILFADADAVRPAHIVDFFALLGGGQKDAGLDGSGRPVAQLAILPGLTHYNINSSPALALAVTPFLDAPMPAPK